MPLFTNDNPLVFTVKDRCKVCFTCVRECPAKAIKIINGQAEVITDRCIGCGNCVKVCSQGAKTYKKASKEVFDLIKSKTRTAAIIAPSFPAEFAEIDDYKKFVGMVKALGFDFVCEVAFGADLVAREYKKLIDSNQQKTIITSDCPGIVFYLGHYIPELVKYLAPIVSPMVAMTKVVRAKYGDDIKVVFFGPCIAKKAESDEVDFVLTFNELREMFFIKNITKENVQEQEFDPPYSGRGAVFPISRGMLQTVNKSEAIWDADVVVTDGHINFREALDELEKGFIHSQYVELLCCEGCIMGAGMTKNGKKFIRKALVKNYVHTKLKILDRDNFYNEISTYQKLNFSTSFTIIDRRIPQPSDNEINEALQKLGKNSPADYLNCGACGYRSCVEHAVAIVEGLAEVEMCLPVTIEKLNHTINDLNESNKNLAKTQQALKQSEKLANMGQLSAGIAHELNNPLGVITVYSNLLKEEVSPDSQIYKDLELIAEQANRCKKIVGGLLNFARKNQLNLSDVELNQFVQRSIESMIIPENIEVCFDSKINDLVTQIDKDQMMQVLTNLEKNAIDAMPDGGKLTINLAANESEFEISVIDTGTGILKENMDKIFTPFFTTKEVGKGTGLGLPLIYGIVKMHSGKIDVISNADPNEGPTGTQFVITIPFRRNN